MRRHFNIPIIFSTFWLIACSTKHKFNEPIPIYYNYTKGFSFDTLSTVISHSAFSSIIDSIEYEIKDLTSYDDVLHSKKFIHFYESPSPYLNNVLVYLSDTVKSKQKRMIALLTMQRRGITNNLNFLYASNYLFKKELIDEIMINQILFPIDLKNRDLIKYFESHEVRAVLLDLKDNPISSKSLKSTITEILSGKTYYKQKHFLFNNYGIKI